ncbi:hypothetical protein SynBIOSE41_02814 [Synechococcus sp. BIOS-E4-1]|nr:hypothetical protein SynBIOSE41_02814 [Synechococcus sp. BIOS-E4-1]
MLRDYTGIRGDSCSLLLEQAIRGEWTDRVKISFTGPVVFAIFK